MTTSAPIKILACVQTIVGQSLNEKLMWYRISGQAEKELLSALALKEPTYAEIDALLAK